MKMNRMCAFVAFVAFSTFPLPAKGIGCFDLGVTMGTRSHYFEEKYDESKLAVQYGLTMGLSDVYELDVTGTSEVVPDFFEGTNTTMQVLLQRSLLGERNTGTAVSGIGLNTLLGFGVGLSTYHESGEFYPTHLLFSLTPVTIGTPMMGKREKLCTLTLAVNIYDKSVSLYFDLMSFDFYLLGSWFQHRPPTSSTQAL
ncbi:MAG: hypothetical protein SPF89_01690 [Sphaerochaetaceae bacterium]|nr:hypothetical protein [Spirochaetales bacterium]MDY5498798.1 hypothetical protein [Sphaerochaetaceae bacterium]